MTGQTMMVTVNSIVMETWLFLKHHLHIYPTWGANRMSLAQILTILFTTNSNISTLRAVMINYLLMKWYTKDPMYRKANGLTHLRLKLICSFLVTTSFTNQDSKWIWNAMFQLRQNQHQMNLRQLVPLMIVFLKTSETAQYLILGHHTKIIWGKDFKGIVDGHSIL